MDRAFFLLGVSGASCLRTSSLLGLGFQGLGSSLVCLVLPACHLGPKSQAQDVESSKYLYAGCKPKPCAVNRVRTADLEDSNRNAQSEFKSSFLPWLCRTGEIRAVISEFLTQGHNRTHISHQKHRTDHTRTPPENPSRKIVDRNLKLPHPSIVGS